ncbi:iron ABC transporter permease [Peribacillus sp. ACCC06369]|uniref:FecCD family ABC transporter permease n=1 Tax=Peribacillus sp. ACCC06369 TaxID=3055860 RepID=UPI0025A0F49C|nr:iron ABC transporter permease [Peribacillus sp. ACCC06369]MDM5361425.1 iron ABC transporter permease [Peribacillus sp. ACCC06369]
MPNQSIRTYLTTKWMIAYLIALLFLLFAMTIGISFGSVPVPIPVLLQIIGKEIFHLPISADPDVMLTNIVMNIRLPRVLLAGFVGASLAISGAGFQGLLRNPLADPYTLGISSGASVGAVLTIFLNISLPFIGLYTLPALSIVCSVLTMFCVLAFAKKMDRSMKVETIILTGIIFSSFLSAFISLMIALTGDELRQIIGWLMGSVSMRGWNYIAIILPFFIIGSLILIMNTSELNAMTFGEDRAKHLGVNVKRRKMWILIAGSVLTGAAVAVSGAIGFVGLVIPHFVRKIWGPDHKHLLPLSLLVGSGFLILADFVARSIIAPSELPIGVITSLIGAPAFALILLKRRREG